MAVKAKQYILTILVLSMSLLATAQDQDFGTWWSIGGSHKLMKKTDIDVEGSLRTDNNSTHLKSTLLATGISYSLTKKISTSVNYRFNLQDDYKKGSILEHRFSGEIKGKLPLGYFDFSARGRYQYETLSTIRKESDKIPEEYLRVKLEASYDWPSSPLSPYISMEYFYPLTNERVNISIDKKRIQTGISFKKSKKASIDVGFLYQRGYLPSISEFFATTVSYKYDF